MNLLEDNKNKMSKYDSMHTQDLIKLAIEVNAEIHARLTSTMFVLSSYEKTKNDEYIKFILERLRGVYNK